MEEVSFFALLASGKSFLISSFCCFSYFAASCCDSFFYFSSFVSGFGISFARPRAAAAVASSAALSISADLAAKSNPKAGVCEIGLALGATIRG
jgi:hypothetical protein